MRVQTLGPRAREPSGPAKCACKRLGRELGNPAALRNARANAWAASSGTQRPCEMRVETLGPRAREPSGLAKCVWKRLGRELGNPAALRNACGNAWAASSGTQRPCEMRVETLGPRAREP